jgi:hypothetical protein
MISSGKDQKYTYSDEKAEKEKEKEKRGKMA